MLHVRRPGSCTNHQLLILRPDHALGPDAAEFPAVHGANPDRHGQITRLVVFLPAAPAPGGLRGFQGDPAEAVGGFRGAQPAGGGEVASGRARGG